MCYLYFDESIIEKGDFIIGALVVSNDDLSLTVRKKWRSLGLDPNVSEYKSSPVKNQLDVRPIQRPEIRKILRSSKLALIVCPNKDRQNLGAHCAALIFQLLAKKLLPLDEHFLYVDENIRMPIADQQKLTKTGVYPNLDQNSKKTAGIQVADYAAHSLGVMLSEKMGLVKKLVVLAEESCESMEVGFELWASLRSSLLGKTEYIPGFSSDPQDPVNHYSRVEGYGLYIADSCSEALASHALKAFGVNYLGCIH
jgi:hypothetical protein